MKSFIKNWLLPPGIFILIMKMRNSAIRQLRGLRKDFKKNINVKGIHRNDRCFVVGLGNSINKQNLSLLKDEIVIGVSGLFTHSEIRAISPKYYVLSPVFKNHLTYNKEENFISWLRAMDRALDDEVRMFIHIGDKPYIEKYNIFVNKIIYWNDYQTWYGGDIVDIELDVIPAIESVSEAVLSVALYLGFKEIFMLGFDHTWYEKHDNHFDNERVFKYFKKTQRQLNSEFGWDSESHMRAHANMFRKYKKLYQLKRNIFNANANEDTYVDTFPKVKFEDLF